jgi:hypothetical protein
MKSKLKLPGLIIVAIYSTLFLINCGVNDEGSQPEESDLIGTWSVTSATVSTIINNEDPFQYSIDELGLTPTEATEFEEEFYRTRNLDEQGFVGIELTFNADRTWSAIVNSNHNSGNYTRNGVAISLDNEGIRDLEDFEIIRLSSNILELSSNKTLSEDLNGDDVEELIEADFSIILNQ